MAHDAPQTDQSPTTDAPHGWIWLDDDGWEHNPNEQHPQDRSEAEYGTDFRPATEMEAASPDFLRCPELHMSVSVVHEAVMIPAGSGWIEVRELEFKVDD